MLMSSPRSPVLPESPLDVLSRAASMVESGSSEESDTNNGSPPNTHPNLVGRTNSFKDLHPKFRRHGAATEYLSLADSIRAQKLGRQISLTTSKESVSPPVSPPTYPGPPVPLEPEAPLDFSIRKRSSSPVQPPPYKYTNPLRQHEPPLSRGSQSPPPSVSHHQHTTPHLPVNPAPSYYRPPPYPRTPSPTPPPPTRPPPPSYEAAIAAKPISPRVVPPILNGHGLVTSVPGSSAFLSLHHPPVAGSAPQTTSAFISLHPSAASVPTTSPTFITLHPRPSPGRTADYSPPAKETRNLDPNRPSVITTARRDREQEDKENKGHKREMTIVEETGACDLMEEHFRKSLGADYSKLFKEKPEKAEKEEEEKMEVDPVKAFKEDLHMSGNTVEDHFAKALGETWTKLQAKEAEKKEKKNSPSNSQPNVPKESKSQLLAL